MNHSKEVQHNPPTPHCHPQSLDSASTPEAFVQKEIDLGTGTVTVTDHGSLAACRKIYDLAHKGGYHSEDVEKKNLIKLTPILGLEAYLRDEYCPILTSQGHNPKEYAKYFHATLHFLDQKAFETASRIISTCKYEKHGEESKPIFTWENFEELGAQNVMVGSGCLIGYTMRHLLDHGSPENAEAYYKRMRSLFKPGNFFVEVFPHVCDRNWDSGIYLEINEGDKITSLKLKPKKKIKTNIGEIYAEDLAKEFNRKDNKHEFFLGQKNYRQWILKENPSRIISVVKREGFLMNECSPWAPGGDAQKGGNEFVLGLARKYGDKVLISDDSHYADVSDRAAQDVRLMAGGGSWRMSTTYNRMSGMECWDYFSHKMGIERTEFDAWINNAFEHASRFKDFRFDYKAELPSRFFPSNTIEYLKQLIKKHGRMQWNDKRYTDRLSKEIELFHNNGTVDLLPYFFVYEEIAEMYQKAGKLTAPGRGSASGVLLSYLLSITHVDPIKNNLSLERFITLDRIGAGTFPDIDFDMSDRTLLLGGEQELFECETEDGREMTFYKGQLVKTPQGLLKVEDALRNGLEIYED